MFFFYFNLIFEYKLVILFYFFFVYGEIKLTYLLTYLLSDLLTFRLVEREQCYLLGHTFLAYLTMFRYRGKIFLNI